MLSSVSLGPGRLRGSTNPRLFLTPALTNSELFARLPLTAIHPVHSTPSGSTLTTEFREMNQRRSALCFLYFTVVFMVVVTHVAASAMCGLRDVVSSPSDVGREHTGEPQHTTEPDHGAPAHNHSDGQGSDDDEVCCLQLVGPRSAPMDGICAGLPVLLTQAPVTFHSARSENPKSVSRGLFHPRQHSPPQKLPSSFLFSMLSNHAPPPL